LRAPGGGNAAKESEPAAEPVSDTPAAPADAQPPEAA